MTGPKADIIAVEPAQFQPISIRQTAAHASAENTLEDNTLYLVTSNKQSKQHSPIPRLTWILVPGKIHVSWTALIYTTKEYNYLSIVSNRV